MAQYDSPFFMAIRLLSKNSVPEFLVFRYR